MPTRGRPPGFGEEPDEYQDRFQKFYYTHRERLNDERRGLYKKRKALKVCVRCGKGLSRKNRLFCERHIPSTRAKSQGS